MDAKPAVLRLQESGHEGRISGKFRDARQIGFDSPDPVLMPNLPTMLDARQPLYRPAQTIDRRRFESAFGALYSDGSRPALPIRRLV